MMMAKIIIICGGGRLHFEGELPWVWQSDLWCPLYGFGQVSRKWSWTKIAMWAFSPKCHVLGLSSHAFQLGGGN
jgi:hypothetical protein